MRVSALALLLCSTLPVVSDTGADCPRETTPIILIHGLASSSNTWDDFAKTLPARPHNIDLRDADTRRAMEAGSATVPDAAFYTLDFSSNRDLSLRQQGDQLAWIVRAVRRATGAKKVVLVGHSMGGLAARAYLQFHSADDVAALVTVGTPHAGSPLAYFKEDLEQAWGVELPAAAVEDLRPDGPGLVELNRAPLPRGPRYVCVLGRATDLRWKERIIEKYMRAYADTYVARGSSPASPQVVAAFSDGVVPIVSQYLFSIYPEQGYDHEEVYSSAAHMRQTSDVATLWKALEAARAVPEGWKRDLLRRVVPVTSTDHLLGKIPDSDWNRIRSEACELKRSTLLRSAVENACRCAECRTLFQAHCPHCRDTSPTGNQCCGDVPVVPPAFADAGALLLAMQELSARPPSNAKEARTWVRRYRDLDKPIRSLRDFQRARPGNRTIDQVDLAVRAYEDLGKTYVRAQDLVIDDRWREAPELLQGLLRHSEKAVTTHLDDTITTVVVAVSAGVITVATGGAGGVVVVAKVALTEFAIAQGFETAHETVDVYAETKLSEDQARWAHDRLEAIEFVVGLRDVLRAGLKADSAKTLKDYRAALAEFDHEFLIWKRSTAFEKTVRWARGDAESMITVVYQPGARANEVRVEIPTRIDIQGTRLTACLPEALASRVLLQYDDESTVGNTFRSVEMTRVGPDEFAVELTAKGRLKTYLEVELPGGGTFYSKTTEHEADLGFDVALILDVSFSMDPRWEPNAKAGKDPIGALRRGAASLVDALEAGDAVAVVTFSGESETAAPLAKLDDRTRAFVVEKLRALSTRQSGTNFEVGLVAGIGELLGATRRRIAVLLSDGTPNRGDYTAVVKRYRKEGIPIFTIGFEGESDWNRLRAISEATGGAFYPADSANIREILGRVHGRARGLSQILHDLGIVRTVGERKRVPFSVPAGLKELVVELAWQGSDLGLELESPSGKRIDASTPGVRHVRDVQGNMRIFTIPDAEAGEWEAVVTALDIPPDGEMFRVSVSADVAREFEWAPLRSRYRLGEDVRFQLEAAGKRGGKVTAVLERPGGARETVDLSDDGAGGDDRAGDGVYTGVWTARETGIHRLRAASVSASFAVGSDSEILSRPDDEPAPRPAGGGWAPGAGAGESDVLSVMLVLFLLGNVGLGIWILRMKRRG